MQFNKIIISNEHSFGDDDYEKPIYNVVEVKISISVRNIAYGYNEMADIYDEIKADNVAGFDLDWYSFKDYMQVTGHALCYLISEALENYYLHGIAVESAAQDASSPPPANSERNSLGFAERNFARQDNRRVAFLLFLLVVLIAFAVYRQMGPEFLQALRKASGRQN